MGELSIENITSEDIEALIIGLLCNMEEPKGESNLGVKLPPNC